MRTCHTLSLGLLAALGWGTVPAGAQDRGAAPLPDTTGLAVVFVVFPEEGMAQTTMDRMNKAQASRGEAQPSYAVVSRDAKGKLKVHKRQQSETRKATEVRADTTVDGVVALLGQPRGQGQADAAGGQADTAGGQAGNSGVSSANMDEMQQMLTPGTSAVILVVPEPMTEAATSGVDAADTTDTGKVVVMPIVPAE
jgi:uncharacterized membrane protein